MGTLRLAPLRAWAYLGTYGGADCLPSTLLYGSGDWVLHMIWKHIHSTVLQPEIIV